MAKKTENRIDDRNRMAEAHRAQQGPVARAVSGAGLAIANTWDRVTGPFKSDRAVFGGATAFGISRGAVVGAIAGILAGLAFGPLGAALTPFLLGGAAIGAIGAGIKDGQGKLEAHWKKSNVQTADKIARATGAVPGPDDFFKNADKSVQYDLTHPHKPSRLIDEANAALAKANIVSDQEPVNQGPSFAERENMRRAGRGPATAQQP